MDNKDRRTERKIESGEKKKQIKFGFSLDLHYLCGGNRRKGLDMCTYIAEIKATYTEVGRETSRVARKSFSKPVELINKENFDIDEFLDAINIITKDLNSVTQATHDLIEVVRNNFCEISTSEAEELLELSHPIYDKMQKLYHKLLSSPFYKGMKTAVELYSDAMSEFDELCHDLKTFRIDLEQNDEFKEVERKLSEMLRR